MANIILLSLIFVYVTAICNLRRRWRADVWRFRLKWDLFWNLGFALLRLPGQQVLFDPL